MRQEPQFPSNQCEVVFVSGTKRYIEVEAGRSNRPLDGEEGGGCPPGLPTGDDRLMGPESLCQLGLTQPGALS